MGLSSVFGFTGESKRPWPRVEATTTACWQRWAIRTTWSSSKWLLKHFFTWFFSSAFAVDVFGNSDFVFQYDEEMNVQQTYMSTNNSTSGHLNISFFSPSDSASESGSYIYSISFLLIAEIVHQSMGYFTYIYICSHTRIRISPTNHIRF